MNKEEIKKELIGRYKYIYENASFILAPYMYQQTKEERERLNRELKKLGYRDLINNKLLISLKALPKSLLLDLESFLLSDIPFKESNLYKTLEIQKKNLDYLKKVKLGLNLVKDYNADLPNIMWLKLNSWKLFTLVRKFINEQSGDLQNKENKLVALDEYFRIDRYSNDGKIWTSGYSINFKDLKHLSSLNESVSLEDRHPRRELSDIGLKKGNFIKYLADIENHYKDNLSLLTEEEKQAIYLTNHDELPWNLELVCNNDININLTRPEHTNPCGKTFYVNEEEIFVDSKNSLFRYYQLCPHCGYIVHIPNNMLPYKIRKKIEERCSKDSNLFRKMYLYSELFSLDKSVFSIIRKLIKENK